MLEVIRFCAFRFQEITYKVRKGPQFCAAYFGYSASARLDSVSLSKVLVRPDLSLYRL